jgi:hypothetical protein
MRRNFIMAMAAAGFLAGCSSTDMAMLAVGLQEANGTYWPDQSQSQPLECSSGNGYIMEYSGVSGGQGYLYFVSYADDYAEITVTYDDGDVYDAGISYGETSYTMYNHPGYAWNSSWVC